jgi:hypothetical protein
VSKQALSAGQSGAHAHQATGEHHQVSKRLMHMRVELVMKHGNCCAARSRRSSVCSRMHKVQARRGHANTADSVDHKPISNGQLSAAATAPAA